jgi:5-methylthioribose kinase
MVYPGEFFLTVEDLPALSLYLGERVEAVERAGEGNMNCVLRVRTAQRSFIVKQSRPWVEKYPNIAAPWDRAVVEARFYREVEREPRVAGRMPKLLGFDARQRVLLLEDLGAARDFAFEDGTDAGTDVDALVEFLIALHRSFRDPDLAATFRNADMRALNHEHIFVFPLRPDNGLDLDAITPGLAAAAWQLSEDREYCAEVARLGERYLDDARGTCLLHGDYFPGSWLRARGTVYVIDPEFCFWGMPEWDLGVMAAHMHLAGLPAGRIAQRYGSAAPLDRLLMAQFAGVEIMRRLIGVAQLPLRLALDRKRELLELSRALVLGGGEA